MSKKKQNKEFDVLESKRQKKPKIDNKFDPSRKNKKHYLQAAYEHIQ